MPVYHVTAPDGTKYKVNAPEGATEADVLSYAKEQFAAQDKEWEGSSNQEQRDFSWMETAKNVPGSALKFGKGVASGLAEVATNPIDTLKSILLSAEGGVRKAAPDFSSVLDTANPFLKRREGATEQDAERMAGAIGEHYSKRYGGLENIKRTVQEDPVGTAADLSAVLGVGGMLAPGRAGQALNVASKYTNPLSVIPPVVKGVGSAATTALGITTGTGKEAVSQAFQAGKNVRPVFLENARGDAPITDLLDTAKQGLETVRQQKSAAYRANMAAVSADKAILKFDGIDDAVRNAFDTVTYKGQVKNARAAEAVQSMARDVTNWKLLKPTEFHTPEGLDALKQRLGGTLESIPFEERTARLAAGKIYNAVKDEITKQAPTYAKTMEDYTKASEQIGEIERALSLGKRSSQDTAVRKLQSLTRNNVQTNYGNRISLAKELESMGNVDLMPAVAGQAMNTWAPRGLVGQAGAYATGAAALSNPYSLLALPFQSPKAVGLGSYGLGRTYGVLGRGADKLGITPERARLMGLLGYELDQK